MRLAATVALLAALSTTGADAAVTGRSTDDFGPYDPAVDGPVTTRTSVATPLIKPGRVYSKGTLTFTREALPEPDDVVQVTVEDGAIAAPDLRMDESQAADALAPPNVTWCYYNWQTAKDHEAVPELDDRWVISKADYLANQELVGFAAHGGESPNSYSAKTDAENEMTLTMTGDWPQGARMAGIVNPKFRENAFVDSNQSIYGATSFASTQLVLKHGWSSYGNTTWKKMFNVKHELGDGTDGFWTDSYPGNVGDGWFAWTGIIGGGTEFTYNFRTEITAHSETDFLAGSRAQIDNGSAWWAGTVPTLGPNNQTWGDPIVDWALVKFELPAPWFTNCS